MELRRRRLLQAEAAEIEAVSWWLTDGECPDTNVRRRPQPRGQMPLRGSASLPASPWSRGSSHGAWSRIPTDDAPFWERRGSASLPASPRGGRTWREWLGNEPDRELAMPLERREVELALRGSKPYQVPLASLTPDDGLDSFERSERLLMLLTRRRDAGGGSEAEVRVEEVLQSTAAVYSARVLEHSRARDDSRALEPLPPALRAELEAFLSSPAVEGELLSTQRSATASSVLELLRTPPQSPTDAVRQGGEGSDTLAAPVSVSTAEDGDIESDGSAELDITDWSGVEGGEDEGEEDEGGERVWGEEGPPPWTARGRSTVAPEPRSTVAIDPRSTARRTTTAHSPHAVSAPAASAPAISIHAISTLSASRPPHLLTHSPPSPAISRHLPPSPAGLHGARGALAPPT